MISHWIGTDWLRWLSHLVTETFRFETNKSFSIRTNINQFRPVLGRMQSEVDIPVGCDEMFRRREEWWDRGETGLESIGETMTLWLINSTSSIGVVDNGISVWLSSINGRSVCLVVWVVSVCVSSSQKYAMHFITTTSLFSHSARLPGAVSSALRFQFNC